MNGKPAGAKEKLKADAERVLASWEGIYHTSALFAILPANSDGDNLIVDGVCIPMLRQQKSIEEGKPNYCLTDFVRPLSQGITDEVGLFCTTVDAEIQDNNDDAYDKMMCQVLCDRLAEGTAEKMHEEVRRHYWGYAPDEDLSIADMLIEKFQGIRPAVGYPSLPDTSLNFVLDDLLDMKQIGIRLTESGAMKPHASVSGLMLAHPEARYFNLGKIGEDQLRDYARRRGLPIEICRKFLAGNL
jgi:cobalamin-dependent methionine synthase I